MAWTIVDQANGSGTFKCKSADSQKERVPVVNPLLVGHASCLSRSAALAAQFRANAAA